jgi:hypothetical protein
MLMFLKPGELFAESSLPIVLHSAFHIILSFIERNPIKGNPLEASPPYELTTCDANFFVLHIFQPSSKILQSFPEMHPFIVVFEFNAILFGPASSAGMSARGNLYGYVPRTVQLASVYIIQMQNPTRKSPVSDPHHEGTRHVVNVRHKHVITC